MARILVTGGAGFIGSHLAKRLLAAGSEVVIVDNLSSGNKDNLPDGALFIEGDISDKELFERLPKGRWEGIMHLAAQSSGEVSFSDPLADLMVNTGSTLLLLDWSLRNNIEKFIYASSMSVYGPSDGKPISETYVCKPSSFYGASKLASEKYLNIYSELGIKTTALRFFNVYGPGQNLKNMKQGMASIYLSFILRNEPIEIKGSIDRFRDFVYVDDVVDAIELVYDNPKSSGKIYNIGTGKKTTVEELINELLAASNKESTYPRFQSDDTPGDLFGLVADTTLITDDIGWSAKTELTDGIKKMVESYLG